jgi:hypothetical protein
LTDAKPKYPHADSLGPLAAIMRSPTASILDCMIFYRGEDLSAKDIARYTGLERVVVDDGLRDLLQMDVATVARKEKRTLRYRINEEGLGKYFVKLYLS